MPLLVATGQTTLAPELTWVLSINQQTCGVDTIRRTGLLGHRPIIVPSDSRVGILGVVVGRQVLLSPRVSGRKRLSLSSVSTKTAG